MAGRRYLGVVGNRTEKLGPWELEGVFLFFEVNSLLHGA